MAGLLRLRISKRHHKHVNNPFPSTPRCLPFIHGELSFNPDMLLFPQHPTSSFRVGDDFELHWTSTGGGHLSVSHRSRPGRSVWSTVPGEAFVSAAAVRTEVLESRGSFAVIDGNAQFICKHQTVEGIRILHRPDAEAKANEEDHLLSGFFGSSSNTDQHFSFMPSSFPVAIVTGWVFNRRRRRRRRRSTSRPAAAAAAIKTFSRIIAGSGGRKDPVAVAARYWLVFEQKGENQIGFYVKFGECDCRKRSPAAGTTLRTTKKIISSWKLTRIRRRFLSTKTKTKTKRKRGGFVALASDDETGAKDDDEEIGEFNRVFLSYASDKEERFYGFGEQFSCVEFKGKKVPVIVQEQGIGRGDQPITFAANLVSYRSGGDWSTTYAPSPWYMTSQMRALYLEGYDYSVFDLTKPDRVQIQIHGNSARGRILNGHSPVELIECFTEATGRPPELPNWIISGAVVGMQGGTDAVRRVWKQLQDHDVPVSAFWLQDWVGKRETIIGSQLWWNWEVDDDHYGGWRELVSDLRTHNIRVMTYCNPCLVPTDGKPNKNKNLFEEAKRLDLLVKDKDGGTYMIPNTAFDVGMLDLTHPKASCWFKKILQEMVDTGVRGWMADFGEGLPLDACLYSDEEGPIAAHNRYPELWAKVNRELVDEWKEKEGREESLVFFMRAGFRDSPKWAMLFWEGDQMVSWQANDGIKSSVTGLLSGGLSGFAFNHSDIGGYCTVNMPIIRYQRSEELLMRWMELNAFSTVFRTHEGNKPSSNFQFYSNRSTLAQFARCAKMYKAWKFYRIQLVKEAAERGLPVARHLFLHYPHDERVHGLTYQQFLVGTEMLVVPVLDKGRKEVKAYLPLSGEEGGSCSWQHVWSGRIYSRPWEQSGRRAQGCEAMVEAPIGYPAVFVKCGSEVGEAFMRNLKGLNIL